MIIAQRLEQKACEEGRLEGIQTGEQRVIEKGENEESLKIACIMVQNSIDFNIVMAITGLTEDALA
jgi:predicted transposase/invertase (TIGR01784 family)